MDLLANHILIGAASAYHWLARCVLIQPHVILEFVTLDFAVWYQEAFHASPLIQAVSVKMSVRHYIQINKMFIPVLV